VNILDKKNTPKRIGGQALISGIMMRGEYFTAMACRLPDGTIDVEDWHNRAGGWITKVPLLRGTVNFVLSLSEGIKCTIKSAEKAASGEDDEAEMSAFEKKLDDLFGKIKKSLFSTIMVIICILSVAVSILVFKFVPTFLSGLLKYVNAPAVLMTVTEGIVKFALICGYMFAVSKTAAMKELFAYHGAEHKTIACFESGKELTVENVRPCTRFHRRCGTSFILLVIILSICIGLFLPWDNVGVRYALQLALLIPESAIAYELIRFASKHDNIITKIISAPGIALQHITTREPDDGMIEVAIAAAEKVI
jgi:uncharacterized protein YqhQ